MIFKLFKSLLLIYLLLGTLVFFMQRSMIYHPVPAIEHQFDGLVINNQNVQVQSLITNKQNNHVIIYFGGNAEQVVYSATDFEHHFPNHVTYLMQYRGYGDSEGKPTEADLFSDALKLFDETKKTNPDSITVIGRSLGSGVASYLASQRAVDKLVLVTPFDSIRKVAEKMLPMFPVKLMIKDSFDSASRALGINAETLVIVATEDQVIQWSHTENLIQALNSETTQVVKIKAGHNDLDLKPKYMSSIQTFINCHQSC